MATDFVGGTVQGLQQALYTLGNSFISIIPGLVAALIIIVIGYIVGEILKKIIAIAMEKALIDKWIEDRNLAPAIGKLKVSSITGSLVKWYVIALFLAQALVLIKLQVLSDFARILVMYIPAVAGSVVIILLGLLIARFLANKIKATDYKYKKGIAIIVEVIIAYVAIVFGLENLGFKVTILVDAFRIAFTVLVVIIAIAFGIYFAAAYRKDIKNFAESFKKG